MDSKAIRPSFLNVPVLNRDKEAEKRGATDEERSLYHMSQTGGWVLFRDIAHQVLQELDDITAQAIANGASEREIGRNTIVTSLTKDIINRLLNRVEDAKEACEPGDE